MNPLVQVDPGLYIWAITVFVLLVALLTKFAWRPLLDALEQRQDSIRKSLEDAKQARQELEKVKSESEAMLVRARREADAILAQTRTDAARTADELKVKARTDAENIVRNAERQIEQQASRAVEQIRREAVDLSIAIASKILKRNLTVEDNERLIGETLAEIEAKRLH